MAKMKMGAPIGRTTIDGKDIFVGSFIMNQDTKMVYVVNNYGAFFNKATGTAKVFTNNLKHATEEEYDQCVRRLMGDIDRTPMEETIHSLTERLAPAVEAAAQSSNAIQEAIDSMVDAALALEKEQKDNLPDARLLENYTDEEILAELKRRNYHGDLVWTEIVKVHHPVTL